MGQNIPIPGSSSTERVKQNTEAASIKLSDADLEGVNAILEGFEVKGGRYPEHSSGLLVSLRQGWGLKADPSCRCSEAVTLSIL
jgi:hypothetical protein